MITRPTTAKGKRSAVGRFNILSSANRHSQVVAAMATHVSTPEITEVMRRLALARSTTFLKSTDLVLLIMSPP